MNKRERIRITKRKGVRILNERRQYSPLHAISPDNRRHVGVDGRSPQRCSCFMCGNPRKYFGNSYESLTLAEKKALLYEEDENLVEELD